MLLYSFLWEYVKGIVYVNSFKATRQMKDNIRAVIRGTESEVCKKSHEKLRRNDDHFPLIFSHAIINV